MSWNRTNAAAALVSALQTQTGATVFVFPKPPQTLNPPAIVVGRPTEVLYSAWALSVDEVTLPVLCVGPGDGEDIVDGLITAVRAALADPMLGGAVQSCVASAERNWRNVVLAGVDILQAEVTLTIRM
jgi:hypothetical protein